MFEGLASPWHLIVLVVLATMLFGAKRLPETARALGQSARILRDETTGPRDAPSAAAATALPDATGAAARFDVYTGRPLDPARPPGQSEDSPVPAESSVRATDRQ